VQQRLQLSEREVKLMQKSISEFTSTKEKYIALKIENDSNLKAITELKKVNSDIETKCATLDKLSNK